MRKYQFSFINAQGKYSIYILEADNFSEAIYQFMIGINIEQAISFNVKAI